MSGAAIGDLVSVRLARTSCANCGIAFGVPADWERARRDDGKTFYCPNGHPLGYGVNTLEQRLKRAERERDWANTSAQAARDQAEAERRSHAATKGKLTKLRKRAAAGTCPCCTRTFADLAGHMQGQHPDFVEEARS